MFTNAPCRLLAATSLAGSLLLGGCIAPQEGQTSPHAAFTGRMPFQYEQGIYEADPELATVAAPPVHVDASPGDVRIKRAENELAQCVIASAIAGDTVSTRYDRGHSLANTLTTTCSDVREAWIKTCTDLGLESDVGCRANSVVFANTMVMHNENMR